MAKIQIKNSFITSSAQITISSSLVSFSGGISAKNITSSFSGSIPQLSSYFKQAGNSFGNTAILGTNDNQPLAFEINNTERARIDTSGNLLVGTTTSPSSTGLSIGSTGIVRQLLGGMQNTSWRMREKSAIDWCAWTTNINDAGTQDDVTKSSWLTQQGFGNGNDAWRLGRYPVNSSTLSTFIYVNSSGNVGIGTTSPGAKLQINNASDSRLIIYETGTAPYTATLELSSQVLGTYGATVQYTSDTEKLTIQNYGRSSANSTGGGILFKTKLNNTTATDVMVINGFSGNVGIGTTNPLDKLSVSGSIGLYAAGTTRIYNAINATDTISIEGAGGLTFKTYSGGFNTAMVINTSGNVGIGTSSPTAKLQVDVSSATGIRINGTGGYANIISQGGHLEFYKDGTPTFAAAIGLSTPATALSNDIQFATYNGSSWSARMTIQNGGNVGIGTTSPLERITFGSSDSIIARSSATDFNGGYCSRILFNQGGTGYGYLGFYTYQGGSGGGERMRITESGNVGIGITVPGSKLHVVGSSYISVSANTSNIKFEGGGGNGLAFGTIDVTSTYASWIQSGYVLNFGLATYNLLLQPLGGNVGIGTTSPSATLTVIASNNTGSRIQLGTVSTSTFMDANKVNDFIVLTAPYGSTPASVSNGGAKWGIKMNGSIDNINIKSKTAAIYAVSEEDSGGGAGYNRKVGLALHTSGFDLDNAERVRIDSSGNVGIGTTAPAYKLDVSGSISADAFLGKSFGMTGTSGSTAIYDAYLSNGQGEVYELIAAGSPNAAGSSGYKDVLYGKIIIGTGYNGSRVTTYINYVQENPDPRSLYNSGLGTSLSASICFKSGSSEVTNKPAGQSTKIRVKIGSYISNAYAGYTTVRVKRLF